MTEQEYEIDNIPRKATSKNEWYCDDGQFSYAITEDVDGCFYASYHTTYWISDNLWFPSYSSARTYLKKEFGFTGRMKKVVSF